jgi:hypothetical protein
MIAVPTNGTGLKRKQQITTKILHYMKRLLIFLIILTCFCTCTQKKETVHFVNLDKAEFDAKQFKLPDGKMIDSAKHLHDSCMGISFDANALLVGAQDSFFIGSILNKKSMQVVGTLNDLGLTQNEMVSQFNMVTNPCYEKKVFHFPLKSIAGENYFAVELPGAEKAVNEELNNAILASKHEEIETGSWIYLDLNAALKNIVDTIKSASGLQYRKNLLDTANIVLTAVESIMRVSFRIDTEKDMSEKLQALLLSKPTVLLPNSKYPIKFFFISPNRLQVSIDGFFPVIGKFMKAELK